MEEYGIIICDDEKDQVRRIHDLVKYAICSLEDSDDSKDKEFKITLEANSYIEVADYLEDNKVDSGVYFLDIELSRDKADRDGIDLAEFIRQRDPNAQIIFITAYENLAAMTYRRRTGALDFITKNDSDEVIQKRLNETLSLAARRIRESHAIKKMTFSYKMGRRIINENINDILYIITTPKSHRLKIVTVNGMGEFTGDIKKLEVENDFLEKISQSCLANPSNIVEINLSTRSISFKDGYKGTFPRRSKAKMKSLIERYNLKTV